MLGNHVGSRESEGRAGTHTVGFSPWSGLVWGRSDVLGLGEGLAVVGTSRLGHLKAHLPTSLTSH